MRKSGREIKRIAYEQLKDFSVIALYLWIVFGLLVMFKSVILAERRAWLISAAELGKRFSRLPSYCL
jgi:hypothetical protein